MNRILHWGCGLALMVAVGAGWGQSAEKKAKAKTEKSTTDKKTIAPPASDDSLKRARFAETRLKRVEEHRQKIREQYLARLTPADRVKAEEYERRRETHLHMRDSLNVAYMAQMRERARQRAKAQKAEGEKAKVGAKSESGQGEKEPGKKK